MVEALARADSEWRLSIIGTGRERDRLVDLARRLGISDRIAWHGSIPGAASLLRAFDAFVLSSRTEGTPISLLEAMHAGTPVIATTVGGVADVVTSTHALLVVAENPNAIAESLAEIARDPSAAARRAESGRKRVAEAFGSAPWLAAVDAVYHAVRA
jgi:glycosyltransferase involved in cell wall biosynthesis